MSNVYTMVRTANTSSLDDRNAFMIAMFCASGLLVSLVLAICGLDLGSGFF